MAQAAAVMAAPPIVVAQRLGLAASRVVAGSPAGSAAAGARPRSAVACEAAISNALSRGYQTDQSWPPE